ncbi:hypothetical protein GA0070563_11584 [Micromonospora carbonacea]|uniref:Uncharacterized protein n=1 Tax=Micromonospora carbonacea TaxID=47853 RepID=A0A1C5ANN2_9ACTN|nr:hypothetical protein GA0070563_11584 [Micromonospora carbonacea]
MARTSPSKALEDTRGRADVELTSKSNAGCAAGPSASRRSSGGCTAPVAGVEKREGAARRPFPRCGAPPQDRNLSRAASMVPLSGEAYDFMVTLLYEMKLGHRLAGAFTVPPSPIFSAVFAA